MSASKSARSSVGISAAACLLLLIGCATEPVVPPTPLATFSAETSLKSVWKTRVGSSARGRFEPIVIDDTVFVASQSGMVAALSFSTGKVRWRKETGVKLGSGVGGADGQVYVSTEDGVVIALRTSDGEKIWDTAASSEVLTPVSAGFDSVLVRSADGRVTILDPATGRERWTSTFTPPALTLNGYSRPLLLDGGVLIGLDDGRLLALNSTNGRTLWESAVSVPGGRSEIERLADIDADIRVADNAIFTVTYNGKLAKIEPGRGQVVWSVAASSATGIAIVGDAVVVSGDKDILTAYDKETGQLKWQQEALSGRTITAPVALNDQQVLVGDVEGYLHVFAVNDGRIIGRSRVGKKAVMQELVPAANTVLVQTADGTVVAVRGAL